ncbi:hypothetical protein SGLAU_15765 [Streptomyces glaucescens]|uniref:Uncharacterized protein n=1 Tax=Streptomyces glaucescens TaxID=1907 RepID=A0A089YZS8_STRGA|nr:hypothetical protein SGLAU_15765 [Streptomyces glaucescens]
MSAMSGPADGGIGFTPDPADDPDGHDVPHHDAGTRISFEPADVGDAGGDGRVTAECDGNAVGPEWTPGHLDPRDPDTGHVGLGRPGTGSHEVLIYVDPGSGSRGHATARFGADWARRARPASPGVPQRGTCAGSRGRTAVCRSPACAARPRRATHCCKQVACNC